MIIKLVGSPLLLPVGYRALCDDREMISSIVKCILTQLSCIDRYSLAVASDVVIAVRELATAGCVELFLNSSSRYCGKVYQCQMPDILLKSFSNKFAVHLALNLCWRHSFQKSQKMYLQLNKARMKKI